MKKASLFVLVILITTINCTINNNYSLPTAPKNSRYYKITYEINTCADDISAVSAHIKYHYNGSGLKQEDSLSGTTWLRQKYEMTEIFGSGNLVSITADCTAVTTPGSETKMFIIFRGLKITAYEPNTGITRMWSNTDWIIGPKAQTSTASVTVYKVLP